MRNEGLEMDVFRHAAALKTKKTSLQLPQRGQHSPSGTVALAQGIRGQEILRHTVAEFWREEHSD